ncbi:MAG: hypothetical protein C5B54_09065 [Acidobacteria bacterium]|nr:MAG: hypothetical protein C5B54_09065 [Acidobacteriota bacterium]
MRRILNAIRNLVQKRRLDQELDDELDFHLSLQIEENLRKGMTEEEARRHAFIALGGRQQNKEQCREVRAGAFVDTLFQDLRYAIRSLLRSPGLLIVILLTLALGIGASTAIFTVIQAVLLRPLPYPDSERLMTIWMRDKDRSMGQTNYATYQDWKERLHSFQSIAVMSTWEPTLQGYGEPTPLEGLSVSREFFSLLGIGPYMGRDFLPEEDRPNQNRVVILTYPFWKNRLGGDSSILGKQINLSGIPRTVVGILPPQFESILRYDYKEAVIFRPLGYDETLPYACRSCNHLRALGRILPGIPSSQASQEIDTFTQALIAKYPQDYGTTGASIVPLHEQIVSNVRKVLLLLLVGVGLVLLIACSNIASLMLARATRRSQEMTIRAALGAGRGRLLRQLLTESSALALAGGLAGIALSMSGTRALIYYAPANIPRLQNVSIDIHVLLFAFCATVLAALIFGLIPALQNSRTDLQTSIQSMGRSVSSPKQTLRKSLVVANLALALVLLCGTALLIESIHRLLSQRLGFEKSSVITMTITLIGSQYDERNNVDSYFQQVLDRVQSLPGIASVGIVSQLPLSAGLDSFGIEVRDKPLLRGGQAPTAERFAISPGYLNTLRIALVRGRGITTQDNAHSQPVVLANRTLAERIWPGEDPIGKQIHIGETELPWRTVVGVVDDVRHRGLQEPFAMQFYMPAQQWSDTSMTLVARTSINPSSSIASIRRTIRSIDPDQPISQIATMDDVVEATIAQKRFALPLVEFFAVCAVLLAAIGVYGVMAYSVTVRIPEIGLRVALGADAKTILSMILRGGLFLAMCGIAIGLGSSLVLMRFLRSLLFGVQPTDPQTLAIGVFILFSVAFVASALPAIRASRINPMTALRHE